MNARDAMKLLLEGKTLVRDNPRFLMKLDENGTLVSCESKNLLYGPQGFSVCHTMIGEFDRVYEERDHKPCPFCGSTSLSVAYIDETGEELEQWMMDDANRESESDGSMGYDSWDEFVHINAEYYYIRCNNCSAGVISRKGMEDAWAKWDRRTKE